MTNITQTLDAICQQIQLACFECSRNPNDVALLAVSKRHPAAAIEAAFAAGQTAFGENYVQEALEKKALLSHLPIEWHLIGPLQRNKANKAANAFDWIHTVDSLTLVSRLSTARSADKAPLNVLIQINPHKQTSKSGTTSEQMFEIAHAITQSPGLTLRGLMAIPPQVTGYDEQCQNFAPITAAYAQLCQAYPECDTLSMGMSGDFKAAIAQGSTMIRIGEAIFGARSD